MKFFVAVGLHLFFLSNLTAQSSIATLPFYDGFEYPLGEKLTPTGTPKDTTVPDRGLWIYEADVESSDPILVKQPWENSKGLPPCKGNAIQFKAGIDDPIIKIPPQGEDSGTIYASFLFRINSWTTTAENAFYPIWIYNGAQDFIFSFAKTAGSWPDTRNVFTSKVFIKRDDTGDGFTVGISETHAFSKIVYHPKSFNLNQDILIVISYVYDKKEGTSYMWLDPKVSSIEPISTANTLNDKYGGDRNSGGSPIRTNIDKILINKNSSEKTPDITMDELRIANTWYEVVGKPATSSASKKTKTK